MSSSPPPKPDHPLLKSCLIIIGSLAFMGAVTFILIGIGFSVLINAMFPYAEEAAKLPINQSEPSSSSISDLRNQPIQEVPLPLSTNNDRSPSSKKTMTWRVLNTATIDGKQYALFGSDELTNPYQGDTDINEVRSLLLYPKK